MSTYNICFYKEIKLITITFSSNIILNAPIKTKVMAVRCTIVIQVKTLYFCLLTSQVNIMNRQTPGGERIFAKYCERKQITNACVFTLWK